MANDSGSQSVKVETVLRGTVTDNDINKLLSLVNGIIPEERQLGPFREHVRAYSHTKRSIRVFNNIPVTNTSLPYLIKYLGEPDRRVAMPCIKRTIIDAYTSADPSNLLTLTNAKFQFEYVRSGYRYVTMDGLDLDIYQVYKMLVRGDTSKVEKLGVDDEDMADDLQSDTYWIVEVRGVTDGKSDAVDISKSLEGFIKLLSPLVIPQSHSG